jgi:hypothetical protein
MHESNLFLRWGHVKRLARLAARLADEEGWLVHQRAHGALPRHGGVEAQTVVARVAIKPGDVAPAELGRAAGDGGSGRAVLRSGAVPVRSTAETDVVHFVQADAGCAAERRVADAVDSGGDHVFAVGLGQALGAQLLSLAHAL